MTKINLAVIIAGGDCAGAEAKNILRQADYIIAADGGANSCIKLGFKPNIIVGDFDSITPQNLTKLKQNQFTEVIYDPDQNKTDLELAVKVLNKIQPKQAIILGALGDRLDHTLANLYVLDLVNKKINLKVIAANHEIYLVDKNISIIGKPGDIISVLPLTPVNGLTYRGLKWPLTNAKFRWGWIGIRNQLTGRKAQISLQKGKLLIIKTSK